MTHAGRPALATLMTDCNLLKNDSKVTFDAIIDFVYDDKELMVDSKVIVVSAEQGSHDILFLLNTRLIAMHFPETFRSDKDNFSYTSRCLLIDGKDRLGKNYSLKILPSVPEANRRLQHN